jgi:hypothetical protein
MHYLVINRHSSEEVNGKIKFLNYSDRYRVFSDKNKAIEWAKKIGFKVTPMDVSETVGTASVYICPSADIMILPVEIE